MPSQRRRTSGGDDDSLFDLTGDTKDSKKPRGVFVDPMMTSHPRGLYLTLLENAEGI